LTKCKVCGKELTHMEGTLYFRHRECNEKAYNEYPILLDRNEALTGMLRRLEWCNTEPEFGRCHICGNYNWEGHRESCELAKLPEVEK